MASTYITLTLNNGHDAFESSMIFVKLCFPFNANLVETLSCKSQRWLELATSLALNLKLAISVIALRQ